MKYTIGITLATHLMCLVTLANAQDSSHRAIDALRMANIPSGQNLNVKEFDRTIVAGAETYPVLVQAAETLAQQLLQQGWQDRQVTTIVVRIVGDRVGAIAPILTVRVTRVEWQAQPNVQVWARYGGRSSLQLLGYLEPRSPLSAIAATPEIPPIAAPELATPAAPAAISAPAVRSRVAPSPGRDSPIPGQVPEPSDPGYR